MVECSVFSSLYNIHTSFSVTGCKNFLPACLFILSIFHRAKKLYSLMKFELLVFKNKIPLSSFYLWLCWVFAAACGRSVVAAHGLFVVWLLLLLSTDSRVCGFQAFGSWAQQTPGCVGFRRSVHGLSSSGSQAPEHRLNSWWRMDLVVPQHVWDLPRAGITLMSPALAAGFSTTD